jgi:hypothetical protein
MIKQHKLFSSMMAWLLRNTNTKLRLIIVIFALAIAVVTVKQAFAGCCETGYVSGVHVCAMKDNLQLNGYSWRAQIVSATGACYGGGPAISQLGWTWWHAYEVCGGLVIKYLDDLPPADHYNANYRAGNYQIVFNPCGSENKQMGNKGNSYFTQGGNTINLAPDLKTPYG